MRISAGGSQPSPKPHLNEAEICRRADKAGYEWPRHRAASEPPYKLRPDSGRRGPEGLWQRFDVAVSELNRATSKTKIGKIADAFEELAAIAGELAEAIDRDDRKSGRIRDERRQRSA
jgi:hypothetical protein